MTDEQNAPISADEAAHRMYSGTEALLTAYGPAIQDSANRLRDATGMDDSAYQAHVGDMAHAFHDAGIDQVEGSTLHSLLVNHSLEPATQEQVQGWTIDARRELRERYGPADADRRLAAAAQFIKARPELASRLTASGVGSHPRLVLALAERANNLRMTPTKRNER